MRLSDAGRLFFALLAVFVAATCDSPTTSGSGTGNQPTSFAIVLPRLTSSLGATAVLGLDPAATDIAAARLTIRIKQTGQVIFTHEYGSGDPAFVLSSDASSASAGTLNASFKFPPSAEGEEFEFLLDVLNADGVPVFSMGPTSFELRADGTSGTIEAAATYVGPGKDVQGVQIQPRNISVVVGNVAPIACNPVPASAGASGFPYTLVTDLSSIAVVDGLRTQVIGIAPGTTTLRCELLFGTPHPTDAVTVSVIPAPNAGITVLSGAGQVGGVATALANPIKVEVRRNDGLIAAGVTVTAQAASGNGSVTPASATTAADGTASFNWTLGNTVGTQTITLAVPSLSFTRPVSATATGIPGSISGVVRNAQGSPLAGITVDLFQGPNATGSPAATLTTISNGVFSFTLQAGTYTVRTTGSGFLPVITTLSVAAGQQSTLNVTMTPVTTTGSIAGSVSDASTTAPLAGAVVEVRPGANNLTGTPQTTATTGSLGTFQINSLNPGVYTVRAVLSGYSDAFGNVTVTVGQVQSVSIPMSASLSGGQVRIVVTWTDASLDLDARLRTPSGALVFWNGHNSDPNNGDGCVLTSSPFACLQHDAQANDPQGQSETILIGQMVSGTYTFSLYNYTADILRGTPGDASLAASGAQVSVYFGGSTSSFTFSVPAGAGDEWTVFQLTGSTPQSLVPVNTITTVHHPSGQIRAGPTAGAAVKKR